MRVPYQPVRRKVSAISNYHLTSESHVTINSRSSVHPITWRATALAGFLEADATRSTVPENVHGRLEISVRDLTSGTKAYDLQLPRTVHARRFPLVIAELSRLEPIDDSAESKTPIQEEARAPSSAPSRAPGHPPSHLGVGSVTFHGVTIEASAPVAVELDGTRIRISGQTTLDVTSFGFQPPSVLGLHVYPEVTIDFAITGEG